MEKIKDIAKQELLVKEGQTVITTAQLADVYGTTAKNITNNFQRNKDRFPKGKHYFILQGEELREFKSKTSESGGPLSSSSSMYLWTRRGASRHCKILGTDKAWEQFDYLEDNYFDRENHKQENTRDVQGQIKLLAQGTTELYERVEQVTIEVGNVAAEIEALRDELPLFPSEADKIKNAVNRKVLYLLGGKQSNAYKNNSLRQKLFSNCYNNLKSNFDVGKYTEIKRKYRADALKIVEKYEAPYFLAEQIQMENAQMVLDLKGGVV